MDWIDGWEGETRYAIAGTYPLSSSSVLCHPSPVHADRDSNDGAIHTLGDRPDNDIQNRWMGRYRSRFLTRRIRGTVSIGIGRIMLFLRKYVPLLSYRVFHTRVYSFPF